MALEILPLTLTLLICDLSFEFDYWKILGRVAKFNIIILTIERYVETQKHTFHLIWLTSIKPLNDGASRSSMLVNTSRFLENGTPRTGMEALYL